MIPQEEKVILEGSFPIFDENANVNIGEASIISSESLSTGTVRKSIEVLEAQKKNAQTSFYAPSLNVSWNSSPLYSDSTDKWTDASGQLSITLSMKLDNLLPWSSAKENIDTINDAITQQKSLLRESNLNHQNTLYKLRRNITQSANTLETLKLNITLAEETLASYEESYQRGTSDFQTLNTARDNVQAAQNKLLSEQYNLALSILELEKEINVPFGSLLGNE
jgi:outer membrane protein TolC